MGEVIERNKNSDLLAENFSPRFYRKHYAAVDVHQKGELGHYIANGETAGNMPVEYFSPNWWKTTHGLDKGKYSTAFENYLYGHPDKAPSESYQTIRESCFGGDEDFHDAMVHSGRSSNGFIDFGFIKSQNFQDLVAPDPICLYLRMIGDDVSASPNRWFDPAYYLTEYQDVSVAGMEAFAHFLGWGIFENRRPSRFLRPKLDSSRFQEDKVDFLKSVYSINELFELEPPFELESMRKDIAQIRMGAEVHVPGNFFFGEPTIGNASDFDLMVEVYRSYMEGQR